jgi:acyl-CoA synthetase (AMP-forming)/AMP-acid ligase II/thioesterase domain-containing protein/acyl carrier protein
MGMPPFRVDDGKDTICDVIRRWAELQPDAPAFLDEGQEALTYQDLVRMMDITGARLKASGFKKGDRIAIVHPGGREMASLMFGIMSHGFVPIPLNPNFTVLEFKKHLIDRGALALLLDRGSGDDAMTAAQELKLPLINLSASRSQSVAVEENRPSPDDYAVVFATSSTTAESKIVPYRHSNILAHAMVVEKSLGLAQSDVGIIFRSLHYASAFENAVVALFAGGSVVVFPKFEAEIFFYSAREHGATWYAGGPTFHRAIYAKIQSEPEIIEGINLRFIRASSAPLEAAIADELELVFSATLITSYSSSEAGRIAQSCPEVAPRKPGKIGRPVNDFGFSDSEVRIRALDGKLLPVGEHGEIVVRGPQVFGGYENAPKLNAETFVDGWFRTGDEGFFDSDGYLVLTGRIKEMINRGGEKVSPAEVDAALMAHPLVREAATFPIPHPTLGEEVAAAVVTKPGLSLDQSLLTNFMLERLIGFKVPRLYVMVETIPKSEYGKVQRYKLAKELGVADAATTQSVNQRVRAATPLETRLRVLWAQVLKRDRVGLDDNFFLLGGDSLLAVELVLLVGRRLRCWLPAASLFEAGTVAEMARFIEEGEPQACIVPIQTQGDRPPFFCIHGARGQAIGFKDLARRLPQDQPFYGIQAVGWDGIVAPFTRKTDMAAHYASEIRKIQPHGPYYIGGYSFGGKVAAHMANSLKAQGEEVRLLVLLDALSEAGCRYLSLGDWLEKVGPTQNEGKLLLIKHYLWRRCKSSSKHAYDWIRCRILFPIWEHYRATGKKLPFWLRRPDRVNRLMHEMHYPMPSYDGDAIYFRAEKNRQSISHPDRFDTWNQLIKGKLRVIDVSGGHSQFMHEPHVCQWAGELVKILETAQSR